MKPLKWNEIFGNWATLLLTTDQRGEIDLSRWRDEIDVLIASEPNGIYSNGTAGEFYTLAEDEYDVLSRIFAEKCSKAGVPFQIGVSHPCPQTSWSRLQRSVDLAPSAFQVILPDWFPVTNDEAIRFLETMAETAGGIGLVLYNPPHAKRRLFPEDWSEIKQRIPQLIGLKVFDDNGSEDWYRLMRERSDGLSVFIPGHRMASGIQRGAHGAYSNVACLNPFAAQAWFRMIETDRDAALELETRINRFMERYITPLIAREHFPNHACDRFMAILGGWADVGEFLRWPYRSIPSERAAQIRSEAAALLPEFFRA